MAPLRGAIGSDKELERDKAKYSIKRNAINQIKQSRRRSLSDPLGVKVVFFVLSRKGFEDYLALKDKLPSPLWISARVISQSELESLRENGNDVTDFNYVIGVNENEVIDDAIETIREHHPDEVIWVQR